MILGVKFVFCFFCNSIYYVIGYFIICVYVVYIMIRSLVSFVFSEYYCDLENLYFIGNNILI